MPVSTLIQTRRGTAADWTSANPTLAAGEPGFETDTYKIKIGDGSTAWNSLAYFAAGSGTVTSVTAGDTSIVIGGTADDPTVETATLDVIAADHPPATDWSNNSKKITDVDDPTLAQDAATKNYVDGAVGGSVATDAIWDTKGDLAVATAADTASKLAVGSDGDVLTADSGETTGMKWDTPAAGGTTEYDYVERTTSLTVTATSEGTAQAVIDGNSVSYDGSTRIKIEFYAVYADCTSGQTLVILLVEDSTVKGWLAQINNIVAMGGIKGERYLTPSNASHTYHIKAFKTGGTATIEGGAGGSVANVPMFLRITQA